MVIAAEDKSEAINLSKQTAFFRHTGFKGATSHIDDKFGIDVDDIYEISRYTACWYKEKYKSIDNSFWFSLLKMKYTWVISSLACFNNISPAILLSILFF
jgi:hypothetical protein